MTKQNRSVSLSYWFGLVTLAILANACITGCTSSSSTSESAKAYMLEAEPADPSNIVDMKSAMMVGAMASDGTAVIAGKVLSGQDWEVDQATFLIRDLVAEAKDAEHEGHDGGDHSDCAFCQANKKKDLESLALVRIVDDAGSVAPSDARKLIGVKENDIVMAQGTSELLEDGTLVFSASKVFIKK